jgi:hypothetical protein
MILEHGDMWSVYDETDIFCITTNSTLRGNGALVMGRGLALEAKRRFPGIDKIFGREVSIRGEKYGFVMVANSKLAAFQVKYHYWDKADLHLIKHSTLSLNWSARNAPYWRFDLNFPGIGNGKRTAEEVLPIIQYLPDNVHVWTIQ